MSCKDKIGAEREVGGAEKIQDEAGEMVEALRDFRLSVHGWSEVEFSRRRTVVDTLRRKFWRLAVASALGCVLVTGSVSGGVVYQHHLNAKKIAQARMIEQQRLLAEQRNRQAQLEEEDLLARVDSDVSRVVPSAMEPLARLMAEDENQ